ncbi:HEAT repeat domain-containing protein [Bacteroidota bacterium]
MKKSIIIFTAFLAFSNIIISQEITGEQKKIVIDRLSDPSLNTRSAALSSIIKYKVYEARDVLESKIWDESRILQPDYLAALLALDSPRIYELTNAFIDTINVNPKGNDNITPIAEEQRARAAGILFELGDYSKVEYVFDLIEKYKPHTNVYATELLPNIIRNVPTHSERAKNELINSAKSGLLHERIIALMYLVGSVGDDALPNILEILVNDEDPGMRAVILGELLPVKGTIEINLILRNRLSEEEIPSIRAQIADNLLFRFGDPSDYKFVLNYIHNESDSVVKSSIIHSASMFTPKEPDSTITIETMLDTLISYTDQCYGYEWLGDADYENELFAIIQNAQKHLQSSDFLSCAKEIKSFQESIEQVHADSSGSYSKYVSGEAYKFLYYYPKYILERLLEITGVSSNEK